MVTRKLRDALLVLLQVGNFAVPKLSEEEELLDKLVLIHQQDIADPMPQVPHPRPLLSSASSERSCQLPCSAVARAHAACVHKSCQKTRTACDMLQATVVLSGQYGLSGGVWYYVR